MLIIIIAILGIGVFHKQLFGIMHTSSKSVACNARVILKDIWGGGEHKGAFVPVRGSFMPKFFVPIVPGYRLTFELANLNTVSLIVPEKVYDSVSIGSIGFLECTGKNFENFTLDMTIDGQENLEYVTPRNKFDFRI